jgi:ADP-ribosylation factor-like protein 2
MTGDELSKVGGPRLQLRFPTSTDGSDYQALRLDEIRTHRWNILRCSAMTGENLKEGLAWVVEDAKARLFLY